MSNKALARTTNLPSVFNDFFKPWNEWFGNNGLLDKVLTVPAANITESQDRYNISIAAPGLKKSDFNIDLDGSILTISSEKEENREDKDARHTRKEYSYSSFSRSFTLPDEVNQEKIAASYEDGVLNLSLPKKEEAKKLAVSKHIAIQ